ncbi:MAG: thiamine diphosphokinase [Weeksellaceae bacterium]
MRKKVLLFLNGEPPIRIPDFTQFDKIFCTDGAFVYLKQRGILPDVITGDFDKIRQTELPETAEIIQTPNQEFTDFEKSLQIILERGFSEVHIYGGSGKEQDHFLGNLSVCFKFKDEMKLIFYDDYGYYFFADYKTELNGYKGRMISLFPFPETLGITTKGLLYPLNDEDLKMTGRIGIRNQAVDDEVLITYNKGDLLIFIKNRNYEAFDKFQGKWG